MEHMLDIPGILTPFAGFLLCAIVIILAGSRLSAYGDKIAVQTGIGKAWFGLILMASVTSLPELITGISSVSFVDAPDLAAGDVYGSCVFNLMILSVLDALHKKPITSLVRSTHVFAGACSLILTACSGAGILLADRIPALGWLSGLSLLLALLYFITISLIGKFEKKNYTPAEPSADSSTSGTGMRLTYFGFGLSALLVVGAALFLPFFGQQIIEGTGVSRSFFGTLFLAASTSLPELVVSISALRLGSLDLAVGNLFGSNIFNILILSIDDLFYTTGPLFSALSQSHLLSILSICMMTSVAIIGLLFKSANKRFYLATDTLIIFVLYLALMALLYSS